MAWLLGDTKPTDRLYAQKVLNALKDPDTQAAVPTIWALEIANVIVRAEAKHLVSEAQSGAFLEMLSSASINSDHATFAAALNDRLQLARRYRLSAYDASSLELALRCALPLATLDADLNKAARKAGVRRFA